MIAATATAQRSSLELAVDEAVDQKLRFSKWSPELQRAFIADRDANAEQELRYLQVIGLAVTLFSSLLDLWAIPEVALKGLVLRLVVVLPVAVVVILFAPRMRLWHLKLATTYTLVAFAAVVMHLASFGDPATATRYSMATSFLLGMGVLLLPLRQFELAVFAALMISVTIVAGFWPHPISRFLIVEHIVLSILVAGGTLVIAMRTGALQCRNFLLAQRDSSTHAELERNNRILRELSESDPLTGLPNRRSLHSTFEAEFADPAHRGGREVTVMMIDLDHFKKFNDKYGHQAGDRALRGVGRCLETGFRGADGIVARYGGEEFIAAFFSESIAEAEKFANTIRQSVCQTDIRVRGDMAGHLTCSIGLASAGTAATANLNDLTARADRALYRAKEQGRNRVVISERIELRVDRLAG